MSNNIDILKSELKNICKDYIEALEKLRDGNEITQDVFNECTDKKYLFLEE